MLLLKPLKLLFLRHSVSNSETFCAICGSFFTRTWEITAVAQWLRLCATNRKVAGSIPDSATGIFHWHYPSDRTMALGSTQSLTEISTSSISWAEKSGRRVRLTTLPPFWAIVT